MEFETELFKDLEKAFRETDQRMKAMSEEADRRSEEADRRSEEADRRSEEADRRRDEADQRMKAMDAKADRRRDEADQRMKAMDARADQRRDEIAQQMKVTDRKIKEVGKQLGRFGNEVGFFVQEMVKPGLVRLMRERGIDVHRTFPNVEISRDGVSAEYDLIAANGEEVVFVEVKNKLKTEDIKEHIARIQKVHTLFPEYRGYKIIGAVAGMSVSENVATYAQKQGLFVIAPSGDDITLLNTPSFEPKLW